MQIHKLCYYRNSEKSKRHNENGQLVNLQNMDYCEYEQDYVTECGAGDYQKTVACTNCNKVVCSYKAIDGLNPNYQFADFRVTDNLLAYKRREMALGLQCVCGNSTLQNTTQDETQFDTQHSKFVFKE